MTDRFIKLGSLGLDTWGNPINIREIRDLWVADKLVDKTLLSAIGVKISSFKPYLNRLKKTAHDEVLALTANMIKTGTPLIGIKSREVRLKIIIPHVNTKEEGLIPLAVYISYNSKNGKLYLESTVNDVKEVREIFKTPTALLKFIIKSIMDKGGLNVSTLSSDAVSTVGASRRDENLVKNFLANPAVTKKLSLKSTQFPDFRMFFFSFYDAVKLLTLEKDRLVVYKLKGDDFKVETVDKMATGYKKGFLDLIVKSRKRERPLSPALLGRVELAVKRMATREQDRERDLQFVLLQNPAKSKKDLVLVMYPKLNKVFFCTGLGLTLGTMGDKKHVSNLANYKDVGVTLSYAIRP